MDILFKAAQINLSLHCVETHQDALPAIRGDRWYTVLKFSPEAECAQSSTKQGSPTRLWRQHNTLPSVCSPQGIL